MRNLVAEENLSYKSVTTAVVFQDVDGKERVATRYVIAPDFDGNETITLFFHNGESIIITIEKQKVAYTIRNETIVELKNPGKKAEKMKRLNWDKDFMKQLAERNIESNITFEVETRKEAERIIQEIADDTSRTWQPQRFDESNWLEIVNHDADKWAVSIYYKEEEIELTEKQKKDYAELAEAADRYKKSQEQERLQTVVTFKDIEDRKAYKRYYHLMQNRNETPVEFEEFKQYARQLDRKQIEEFQNAMKKRDSRNG